MKKLKQIQIDEQIWKLAKIYVSKNGISLKEFVEKLIRQNINNGEVNEERDK
jgi:hypothetical protein